jgi:hypothetical protein
MEGARLFRACGGGLTESMRLRSARRDVVDLRLPQERADLRAREPGIGVTEDTTERLDRGRVESSDRHQVPLTVNRWRGWRCAGSNSRWTKSRSPLPSLVQVVCALGALVVPNPYGRLIPMRSVIR